MSKLAAGHLLDYCDGITSAKRVNEHMSNSIADGPQHVMVRRLADLPSGKNAQQGIVGLLDKLGVMDLQTVIGSSGSVTRIMGQMCGKGWVETMFKHTTNLNKQTQ